MADKMLSDFASEQDAFDYTRANSACVVDADYNEVFCSRADH